MESRAGWDLFIFAPHVVQIFPEPATHSDLISTFVKGYLGKKLGVRAHVYAILVVCLLECITPDATLPMDDSRTHALLFRRMGGKWGAMACRVNEWAGWVGCSGEAVTADMWITIA